MEIFSRDVSTTTSARKMLRRWRIEVWLQLGIGTACFVLYLCVPVTHEVPWLGYFGLGLVVGLPFRYVRQLEAVLEIAERAVNSSAKGISAQARQVPPN